MIKCIHISQAGEGHTAKGMPCQDFNCVKDVYVEGIGRRFLVAAIADGVGSAEFSDVGASVATEAFVSHVVSCLCEFVEGPTTEEKLLAIVKAAFSVALDAVLAQADEDVRVRTLYDSTLTGVIYDGERVWWGHAGDDGLVALFTDGTAHMLTHRHEGTDASSVKPLRSTRTWEFGLNEVSEESLSHGGRPDTAVASLVLLTDGLLDFFVVGDRVNLDYLRTLLYVPVCSLEDEQSLQEAWEGYLYGEGRAAGTRIRDYVSDDLTLLMLQNPQAVQGLPAYSFDRDAYDAQTRRQRDEQERLLWELSWGPWLAAGGAQDGSGRAVQVPEFQPSPWEPPAVPPLEWVPPETPRPGGRKAQDEDDAARGWRERLSRIPSVDGFEQGEKQEEPHGERSQEANVQESDACKSQSGGKAASEEEANGPRHIASPEACVRDEVGVPEAEVKPRLEAVQASSENGPSRKDMLPRILIITGIVLLAIVIIGGLAWFMTHSGIPSHGSEGSVSLGGGGSMAAVDAAGGVSYRGRGGALYVLGRRLGSDGEGAVYELVGCEGLVAKVYKRSLVCPCGSACCCEPIRVGKRRPSRRVALYEMTAGSVHDARISCRGSRITFQSAGALSSCTPRGGTCPPLHKARCGSENQSAKWRHLRPARCANWAFAAARPRARGLCRLIFAAKVRNSGLRFRRRRRWKALFLGAVLPRWRFRTVFCTHLPVLLQVRMPHRWSMGTKPPLGVPFAGRYKRSSLCAEGP